MITLDPMGEDPPFEQVRTQLATQIQTRVLPAGQRLPTVRKLAEDLGIAANTVARAYRELEQAGLIETRGRAGTFVAGAGVQQEARAAAIEYVDRVRDLGLTSTEAVDLVQRFLDQRARG